MKMFTRCLGIASIIAGASFSAMAGNIPQYQFQKSDSEFRFLEDATEVNSVFHEGAEMIFLGDRYYLNAYTGQGYPIGFDFRYAGKSFNQFAIDNNGSIMLGKDRVESHGYLGLLFRDPSVYASNSFYLGMGLTMYGVKGGEISYKLEGEPGSRTMTIQFAHMQVREPGIRGNAVYSEQIVLHEADGRVDINFLEEEPSWNSFGLFCGLYGWSNEDSILLSGYGLGGDIKVSSSRYLDTLAGNTFITWDVDDELGYIRKDPYSYTFAFTPTGTENFLCGTPADLGAEQNGDQLTVTCRRPADAPATMILVSPEPFTDENLPTQGVSYQVMNDAKDYVTKFGAATMIYYSDDEMPTATFPGLIPSRNYYIKAFGVNGYPSYSLSTAADMQIRSSHPAPTLLTATSAIGGINLKSYCDNEVIIAATTRRVPTNSEGNTGIFGVPTADMKVGSALKGGGQVIYVGPAGDFSFTNADPNRQTFFRAWAIQDGMVSKTYTNATSVTQPSLPYVPKLELCTLGEVPVLWTSVSTMTEAALNSNFVPRMRGENEDEPALAAVSSSGTSVTFTSPVITFGNSSDLKLHFEWSLETAKELPELDPGTPGVVLPEGNEPGIFGMGHSFTVTAGARGTENKIYETSVYNGTMTPVLDDESHYISGTSTMEEVTVALPQLNRGRMVFKFSTERFSTLYLRNIFITTEVGVKEAIDLAGGDLISGQEGALSILSAEGGQYEVYTLDGRHAASVALEAGEGAVVPLAKGIYAVNGNKVVVR